MKPITAILIGAGGRGTLFADIMARMPEKYKIVGVAEPDGVRRSNIQQMFKLPDEACFESWEQILAQPKMADMAIIATQDDMHYHPALKAIDLGYHLYLEKPIAQNAQECADVANAAKKKGVKVLVCFPMRYAPFFKRVKELVMEGLIGDVISIIHLEAAGNQSFAHNYVRGDYHSEAEASPVLLAKSVHDLDVLQWIIDKPCKRVQSFGGLMHFCPDNAPEGAPVRCIDGGCPVADTCVYNCRKLYLDEGSLEGMRVNVAKGLTAGLVPTDEEVLHALKTRDFGLCVYHANNDVVDHQVVNMEFEGGTTVSFSMNAFNSTDRYIRVFGTKGDIYANRTESEFQVYTFADQKKWTIPVLKPGEQIAGAHYGGDEKLLLELYEYLQDGYDGFCAGDIDISAKNHLIGFAAEQSRHTGTVVDLDTYMKQHGLSNDGE